MSEPAIVFFDGHCGLCHRSVNFILPRDRDARFRFAPLGSETFLARVPEAARASLPESVIVLEADGTLRTRSRAVVAILRRLGPGWRLLGLLLRLVPPPLRDFGYDRVAAVRKKWFPPPPEKDACPMLAPELRGRFLP